MNFIKKIALFVLTTFLIFSCKKDKLNNDSNARVYFSQDSVLFDTVFTTIGSSTQNIRVRNTSNQRIKISSIYLQGGESSPFILNVDGASGKSFTDVEIAANDSIYIFIQVYINPTNANSPLIISDAIHFVVNGNQQNIPLEAWGQDAYYHRPTDAITFSDGSYLPYSLCDYVTNAYTMNGSEIVWKNDKPHVIYGYCVVDSLQKLKIQAGTRIYLNSKASIWVYKYGQLQVLGQKGNEVVFQGARREQDYADKPGQWDRIWINEGSIDNKIDYAIIKNGYIGVQAELFGNSGSVQHHLDITNTKIQNMSMWGFYGLAFSVTGGNNVFSNCLEHSVNLTLGGYYSFVHCTFSNFWGTSNNTNGKIREKPTVNINNYNDLQEIPLYAYFGNCIVDGKLTNEISLDLKTSLTPTVVFSNCWIKTTADVTDANRFVNVRKEGTSLTYKDLSKYDFEPDGDTRVKGFVHPKALADAALFPVDIKNTARNTASVSAGAYEIP